MTRVLVYGTLLSGEGNHRLLDNSKLLGAEVITGFTMHNLGSFPGIVQTGHDEIEFPVHGEVYEVNSDTLSRLDSLEGHPNFYERRLVNTKYGPAWVYVYQGDVDRRPIIDHGDWKKRARYPIDF